MGSLVVVWRVGVEATGAATGDTFVGLDFLHFDFSSFGTSRATRLGAFSGGSRVGVGVATFGKWRSFSVGSGYTTAERLDLAETVFHLVLSLST